MFMLYFDVGDGWNNIDLFFLPEKLICLCWVFKVEERNGDGYPISHYSFFTKLSRGYTHNWRGHVQAKWTQGQDLGINDRYGKIFIELGSLLLPPAPYARGKIKHFFGLGKREWGLERKPESSRSLRRDAAPCHLLRQSPRAEDSNPLTYLAIWAMEMHAEDTGKWLKKWQGPEFLHTPDMI